MYTKNVPAIGRPNPVCTYDLQLSHSGLLQTRTTTLSCRDPETAVILFARSPRQAATCRRPAAASGGYCFCVGGVWRPFPGAKENKTIGSYYQWRGFRQFIEPGLKAAPIPIPAVRLSAFELRPFELLTYCRP